MVFFDKRGIRSMWFEKTLTVGKGKTRGGAIFIIDKTNFEINKKIFIMNHVQMDGGGVYLLNCHHATIQNCVFFMNFAK